MKNLLPALFALVLAACGAPDPAPHTSAALEVTDGWAAPTPEGVEVAAGYLTIVNGADAEDRLLSASSDRAESVEVHEMSMTDNIMQMRAVEGGLPIPAGGEVSLQPGGLHLMFFGVTPAFEEGQTVEVRLIFEHAGSMDVDLPVQRGAPENHEMN